MLRKVYLSVYNLFQVALWSYVIGRLLLLVALYDRELIWKELSSPIWIAQTVAPLEVVHSLIGFTGGGMLPSIAQIFGRNFLLMAVLPYVPEIHNNAFLPSLIFMWGSIELVRYPFLRSSSVEHQLWSSHLAEI